MCLGVLLRREQTLQQKGDIMNTVKATWVLTMALLLAVSAAPAFGVPITTMNSADFNIKTFEGDNIAPAGWYYGGDGTTITTDGSSVTWDTMGTTSQQVWWEQVAGSDWQTSASGTIGFTVEVRMKINDQQSAGTSAGKSPFAITASGNTGRSDMFVSSEGYMQRQKLLPDSSPKVENVMDTNVNTGVFHVFRLARESDANGGLTSYWRDGVLVGADLIGMEYLSPEMAFYFGDTTGAGMNGNVSVDYIRMDTTGAWAPVYTPGDTDGNGVVDATDAAVLASYWLQTIEGDASVGDFDGNGIVNDIDATILAANWTNTAANAVPEPSALIGLLGIAATLLLARRKS